MNIIWIEARSGRGWARAAGESTRRDLARAACAPWDPEGAPLVAFADPGRAWAARASDGAKIRKANADATARLLAWRLKS